MTEMWLLLLTGMLLIAVVGLGVYSAGLNKRLLAVEQQNRQQMDRLRQDLNAINSAAIGVGQRLISAEKKLKAAVEKQEVQGLHSTGAEVSLQAIYNRGDVSAQELTDHYGLSEAEANLLMLLKMHDNEHGGAAG